MRQYPIKIIIRKGRWSTCAIENDVDLFLRPVRKNCLMFRQFHYVSFLEKKKTSRLLRSTSACDFTIFFLGLRFYLHDILGEYSGDGLGQVMTQDHAIRILGYFQRQIHAYRRTEKYYILITESLRELFVF